MLKFKFMKRGYSFKRLLYIFLSNNSNEIISDEKRKKDKFKTFNYFNWIIDPYHNYKHVQIYLSYDQLKILLLSELEMRLKF